MSGTRKDYAISLGLASPGRGRLSREAHLACDEAEAQGMVFVDRKLSTSVNANPLPAPAPSQDAPTGRAGGLVYITKAMEETAATPPILRRKPYVLDVPGEGSVRVSVTEACHNCKDSLTFCHCGNPSFLFWKTGEVYSLDA